ncbi:MAG: DUF3955 domain-containing protein [Clostridium sp.]|nr:DUF3955 domain-containing protein [Clostridium sp.]MDU7082516.1 DUF3955 domain-containing protein [Clostridium sp.]
MKKYIPSGVFLGLAIVCAVAFNVIGSKVLEDGTLVEPFFLIPMMWLFIAISGITLGTALILSRMKRKQI